MKKSFPVYSLMDITWVTFSETLSLRRNSGRTSERAAKPLALACPFACCCRVTSRKSQLPQKREFACRLGDCWIRLGSNREFLVLFTKGV